MDVAHLMAAAVLFDIDGVLVLSWRAIPGAAETVRQLTHRGIACAYLTNTTTRTRRQIAEALGAAGIPVAADDVITAGVLTAEYLHGAYPGARCFLVNNGDITEDLPGIDVVLSTEIGPEDCPEAPTSSCSAVPAPSSITARSAGSMGGCSTAFRWWRCTAI